MFNAIFDLSANSDTPEYTCLACVDQSKSDQNIKYGQLILVVSKFQIIIIAKHLFAYFQPIVIMTFNKGCTVDIQTHSKSFLDVYSMCSHVKALIFTPLSAYLDVSAAESYN